LVIQIVPHANGEVFLSKIAVDQDPSFFGYPFTGRTTPKKATNPSYPQRIPDPNVNLTVHNRRGGATVTHMGLGLNTVYYERKSEIRITVPQDVVRNTPAGSIMVMRAGIHGSDYDIDIFVPGSQMYASHLAVCNQTMPSGGAGPGRRFGWL
jgi:hypothetical protein